MSFCLPNLRTLGAPRGELTLQFCGVPGTRATDNERLASPSQNQLTQDTHNALASPSQNQLTLRVHLSNIFVAITIATAFSLCTRVRNDKSVINGSSILSFEPCITESQQTSQKATTASLSCFSMVRVNTQVRESAEAN